MKYQFNESFDVFLKNYFKIEAAKYPFLSTPQIKQRVRNVWKKQQASESKMNDKNSKTKASRRKISNKENFNGKMSPETSGAKQKTKKCLVPLKVDFVPSKGVLKGNSSSESNKRHVSFNKDLYIRYRTTSEESSSSTIKDRKLRKNSKILNENNFLNYQFNNFSSGLVKQRNSEKDKKFDELLNKNCSWSYKSQRDKLNDTEANKKNFLTMDTDLDAELHDNKNTPGSNYKFYCKNLSNDTPDKIDARYEKIWQKDDQIGLNSLQMNNYVKTERIKEINPQNKYVKPRLSQTNKITSMNLANHSILSSASSSEDDVFPTRYFTFDKHEYVNNYAKTEKIKEINPQNQYVEPRLSQTNKITSMNLANCSILSSASSSEDDVYQTRYSTFDKHEYETTDNIDDHALHSTETSDEEDTMRNISNMKTSSVIIEAKAYEEKEYPVIDKQIAETKEQRETNLLKERKIKRDRRDSFREKNSSKTNIESNYIQISDDDLNTDLDFSDNISIEKSNKKRIKEMMVDVTVTPKQHSVSKNKEKSIIDEEINLEDFFNGSFDITAYKPHDSETKSFLTHYGNESLNPVMRTKGGKRKNYKRKRNELVTANKKVKHETKLESKYKKNILTTGEGAEEFNKKPSKKLLHEDKNLNSYQKSNTCSNKIQPQQKKTKEKFDSFNININFLGVTDSPHENRQMRCKNSQMKYEDKNIYDTDVERNVSRYSNRKVRSSSRIASKKIKEIKKIENLSDSEEIIITDDETETNIYNELQNTHKKHNNKEISYNLGSSSSFKAKTDSTNRKKERHEDLSSKMPKQHENRFMAIKEKDNVHHPENNEMNTKHTNDKQTSRPFIHLLKTPHTSKIPMKQNTCRDKKNQASNLNSFYSYMANADHNVCNAIQIFEEGSTKDIDSKNSDLTHCSNRCVTGENSQRENADNFALSKEYTNKSKPRTWEMLENELLKNLNDEQLSDGICKTVILKKQETVMKKEVAKDRNLFTVSNTSMLQTISKSKTGNNYNLKYEIKNTRSKFVGSKTDPTAQQMRRKDSNYKSNAIVNKTIAAMKKCTDKFVTPKVCNADYMASNWQIEKLTDNSHTHKVKQFYLHKTFTTQNKKDSKKFLGYKDESNKDQKSVEFYQKGNLSKAISGTQRNTRDSQKAQCTEYSYNSNKKNLPIKYQQNHSNYNETQTLVPYNRERNNPWENLIDKLHLQEDYQGLNEEIINSNSEIKVQNIESLEIPKNCTQNSKNLESNETLLIQTDYEVNKIKQSEETLSDQHISAEEESDTEQLKIHVPETKKKSFMENLTSRCVSHQSNKKEINAQENNETKKISLLENLTSRYHQSNKKEINAQENNETCKKLELQKINKNKVPEEQMVNTVSQGNAMKSPSFKFKLSKHGALKLKKQSCASSSSNTSEDSTEIKKTKLHKAKGRDGNNVTNKAREKYKTYLKKLFYQQNLVIDEKDKTKSVEDSTASDANILVEPLNSSENNLSKIRDSLMAREEADIFSLSSSDESSDESKINYGTGPMCNLFDK